MNVIRGAAVVVAAALAGAAIGVAAPAPAYADVTAQVSPASVDMKGGDSRTLTLKLTNAGPPNRATVTATAPTGLNGDVTIKSADSACSGSGSSVVCTVDLAADSQKSVVFTLVAKNPDSLGTGQSRTDTSGTVAVALPLRSATLTYAVTLHGPAASSSTTQSASGVTQVSGSVVDSGTGAPVGSATVELLDGTGQTFETTTGSAGTFRFASSSGRQIGAGTLTLSVTQSQYQSPTTKTVQARAGQSYTGISIPVTPLALASSSASVSTEPSVSDSESAYAASGSGTFGLSALLIGFGVSLVVVGIVIIAALVARNRRAKRAAQSWIATDPGVDPWG
jgi:hypothetical protein